MQLVFEESHNFADAEYESESEDGSFYEFPEDIVMEESQSRRSSEMSINLIGEDEKENALESTLVDTCSLQEVTQVSLSDFDTVKLIGEGGYGKVLLVRKRSDPDQLYAMKVLKKSDAWDFKKVQSIKTEREILVTVKHPNVVHLKYAFQSGELFFNLQNGRFGERKARFYAANVALALECFHKKGIIYRDLKPENVLIGNDGYARITDFGLSKIMRTQTKANSFCGTPEYLAPEVVAGVGYTAAVDWWGFGAFLYEMVTGFPPFLEKNHHRLYQAIQSDNPAIPGYLSKDLQDLLKGLLEKDPEKRIGAKNGAEEVKAHSWFKSINWREMLAKKVDPPFIPFVTSDCDTRNFDKGYTEVQITDQAEAMTEGKMDSEEDDIWKGFEYSEGYQYFAHEDMDYGIMDTVRVTDIVSWYIPKEAYILFATTFISLLQGSYLVVLYCIPMALYNLKILLKKEHKVYALFRKEYRRGSMFTNAAIAKCMYYGGLCMIFFFKFIFSLIASMIHKPLKGNLIFNWLT